MALGWCVLLNLAVFAAAYRFANRRMGGDWVQVILDALLLFYAVQYVAVGIPGVLGVMRPGVIAVFAILISVGLWWGAGRRSPAVASTSLSTGWPPLNAGSRGDRFTGGGGVCDLFPLLVIQRFQAVAAGDVQ